MRFSGWRRATDRTLLLQFETNGAHVPNRRFLSTLHRNGEVQNHVTHLTTARGEDRWIGINARVTRDEFGEMLGIRAPRATSPNSIWRSAAPNICHA